MSSDQWPGSWGDKLTIETPEQTALDFPLAGVGSRCLAMVLDTLLQVGVALVLLLIGSLLLICHACDHGSVGVMGRGGVDLCGILYLLRVLCAL